MTKKMDTIEKFDAALDLSPPYNVYTGRDTARFALVDFDESRTSQEFADEADINNIMAKYLKTGTVPVYADRQPFYVDAGDMPSYQEMQNVLIAANDAFMALPSAVRERFGNDPARFVEFANDEANTEELRKMGLLSPEAVERLDKAAAAKAAEAAAKAPGAADKAAQGASGDTRDPPTQ